MRLTTPPSLASAHSGSSPNAKRAGTRLDRQRYRDESAPLRVDPPNGAGFGIADPDAGAADREAFGVRHVVADPDRSAGGAGGGIDGGDGQLRVAARSAVQSVRHAQQTVGETDPFPHIDTQFGPTLVARR
jgi:hypothetical protein